MRVFFEDGMLYVETAEAEDTFPLSLGMSWNEEARLWEIPANRIQQFLLSSIELLLKYSDDSAETVLKPYLEGSKKQLQLSEASSLEVRLNAPSRLDYLPFQKAGIVYALSRPAALIADEMGLGKTVQAIGVVNNQKAIKRVLIVCPASLKLNWLKEWKKWTTRNAYIRVVNAKADLASVGDPYDSDLAVIITNYDILEKVKDKIFPDIDLLVADEAHYAKNDATARAKILRTIAETAKKKIFLTGTPILNRPIELWNLLDMLQPKAWGSREDFGVRYANGHKKYVGGGKVIWNFKGSSRLEELQEKLRRNVMVRRLKKDVLQDLPEKVRQIVPLEVNYKENAKEARETAKLKKLWSKAQGAKSKRNYDAAIQALDKEVNISFESLARLRHSLAKRKAPYVAQFVKEMLDNVEKVVVFAHHKDVIAYLKKKFAKFGVVTLTGDTTPREKQNSVERFQKDPKVRVFLGNILAAGTGHTLTAAQHVVFAELDWVPGNVKQAEDRCHRIGQTDTVFVYHLVADNSLDVILANTLVSKMEVEAQALGHGKTRKDPKDSGEFLPEDYLPVFNKREQKAIRYALYSLASSKKGFLAEDRDIGIKLCNRFLKGKPLTEKQYAYSYQMLYKYAKNRLEPKVVEILYAN